MIANYFTKHLLTCILVTAILGGGELRNLFTLIKNIH